MASKKNGKSGGRRKNKLPADDHLVVKPIKRNKQETEDARISVLLAHCWDLFAEKQQKEALTLAYLHGVHLATLAHKTGEEAYGDGKDYRRMCIKFAYEDCKVINDVERELWRSQDEDPRVIAFGKGFSDKKKQLVG